MSRSRILDQHGEEIPPRRTLRHRWKALSLRARTLVLAAAALVAGIAAFLGNLDRITNYLSSGDPAVAHLTPPKVGAFQGKTSESTYMIVKDAQDENLRVPITLIIDIPRTEPRHHDFAMTFDLTNTAQSDLRVVSITFETTEWSPFPEIVRYIAFPGIGEVKKYFGLIDKDKREYPCKFTKEDKFVVLRPSELDTFEVAICARSPGVYSGNLVVYYSVAGNTDRLVVANQTDLYFIDTETAFSAPR